MHRPSASRMSHRVRVLGVVVIVPVLAGSLLTACGAGSTARQAEGLAASAAPAGVDEAAAEPVNCPGRGPSGDDFILRKVKIVNETNNTYRLSVAPDSWSCDQFSSTDNPSLLNGLKIPPNPRSPLIVMVSARWDAPNVPVTVFVNNPGSDLPWVPVAKTEWVAGGFYGYAPAVPGTSRPGPYVLRDAGGADVGMLAFSACNHQGQLEEDTWNAIRLWPVDRRPCTDSAGVLDDGLPEQAK